MKRCPTCNQTFEEEWLSFCPQDGTTLTSDEVRSEPPPTIVAPPPVDPGEHHDRGFAGGYQPQFAGAPMESVWQPPPPPLYAQPQNNGLAIASMITGIASLICMGPILGIVAVVLGGVALSQIKKDPSIAGSKPFAVTGVVTGSVSLVLCGGIGIFYLIMFGIAAAGGH